MKFEKSCGAVVYRDQSGAIEYLAVRSKAFGHWGFPKGHVEEGESEEETAKREVQEETRLYITLFEGFKSSIEYSPAKGTYKEVVFFIGKSLDADVNIQEEEIKEYKWLNYNEMIHLLTFDTERKVLTEANNFIV